MRRGPGCRAWAPALCGNGGGGVGVGAGADAGGGGEVAAAGVAADDAAGDAADDSWHWCPQRRIGTVSSRERHT